MAQIGIIGLETQNNGTVKVPVFDTGDSARDVYEMVRVQTSNGTGFIPVVDSADATYDYIRVQTQNQGVVAVHDKSVLPKTLEDWESGDESNWNGGQLSDFSVVSSSNEPVFEGSYAHYKGINTSGTRFSIYSSFSTNDRPYTLQWYSRFGGDVNGRYYVIGGVDANTPLENGYGGGFNPGDKDLKIKKMDGTESPDTVAQKSIGSGTSDKWYRNELTIDSSANITMEAFDGGSKLGTLTHNGSTGGLSSDNRIGLAANTDTYMDLLQIVYL